MTIAQAPKLLYRPEEAAEQLGIGRTKVFELLRTRQLRSKLIGRSRRIPGDALAEYIASLPDAPASP